MSQLVQTFIRHKIYVWNFFWGGGIKYLKKYFLQEHIFFRKSFVLFCFSEGYFFRKVTFSKKIYFSDFFVLSSLFFFPYVKNNSCFYDLGHEKKNISEKNMFLLNFFVLLWPWVIVADSLMLTHCCWLIVVCIACSAWLLSQDWSEGGEKPFLNHRLTAVSV